VNGRARVPNSRFTGAGAGMIAAEKPEGYTPVRSEAGRFFPLSPAADVVRRSFPP